MAAETDAPPRQRSSSGGNVFTRKIGPLPMWAWVAIVSAVILGYAYWKNRQSGGTSTTANASQVPQFANQTYTTVQPPSAPDIITGNQLKDDDDDDDDKKKPRRRKHPTHHHVRVPGGGGLGQGTGGGVPPVRLPKPKKKDLDDRHRKRG